MLEGARGTGIIEISALYPNSKTLLDWHSPGSLFTHEPVAEIRGDREAGILLWWGTLSQDKEQWADEYREV